MKRLIKPLIPWLIVSLLTAGQTGADPSTGHGSSLVVLPPPPVTAVPKPVHP